MKSLQEIIFAAKGEDKSDILLKNGKLVNVLSGEIYPADIAISSEVIVAVGNDYKAREVIDLDGMYIMPGFIDGHIHIESSMVEVPQFARAVVPLGTTTVISDPHEIANVLGYEGLRYMMDSSKYNPLNVFFMLPSCVPATKLETAGSHLRAFDIFPFLREKWVVGLAEMMNFPGVLNADENVLDKLKIARDQRIDGHAPGLTGKELNAYIAAGITSDHECTTVAEANEKLRLGMHIMLREGTGTKNLVDLLPLVNDKNLSRCIFCTDDRHPHDIVSQGHINFMIKTAIEHGIEPVSAIRMATLNPAEFFGLKSLGAIAPGKAADLVVVDDFDAFNIKKVFKNGKLVAMNGIPIYELVSRPKTTLRSSVNIKWLEPDDFNIPAKSTRCRVIHLVKDQIVTLASVEDVKAENKFIISDPEVDILRCYVVERHHASGNIGKGLVKGFGLKSGAFAASIAHDSHNIVVVGVEDSAIFNAVVQINKMGGGIAIARADGQILDSLELPIAGLMSNKPLEYVSQKMEELNAQIRRLGSTLSDPLMTLSFMALPVIPEIKLTDKGLVDVKRAVFVPLYA
ncbi:adenine deaminase [candidate division KSB1 bacterium]|nr:adenine deaminase [candidate division KSB1 bacterium]